MTESAFSSINKSLEEAAENLGCTPFQRFRKVTLPLVFPAVSSFVLSIADFGTPSIITGGFGLSSYVRVMNDISRAVINSFLFAGIAVVPIALISGMISCIIVRREREIGGALDTILMVPYLVPGIVMAIGFDTTFNRWPVDLVASAAIIILVVFIRRLPYGVRSTTASPRQIKPSIDEAAASPGDRPFNVFMQITTPLIMPGLVAGAMMSFIAAINELSTTLIL